MEFFKLENGIQVPVLCFGPGMLSRGMRHYNSIFGKLHYKLDFKINELTYYRAILSAINNGYTFIDHSISYGQENLIAKAIKQSHKKREELFLTTRISNQAQYNENIRDVFFRYLKRLRTDYIDLLMFHWPVSGCYLNTWNEMIKLKNEGYCRILGVANCQEHHIEELLKSSNEKQLINQVEVHPIFTQKKLIEYCKSQNIQVEAYTPLARFDERMTRLPLLKNMCIKYNKTLAQLILKWHVQNGIIPVFRSLKPTRLCENMNIFDFDISENDMKLIDSVNINSRLRYDPDNCDFTIL